MKLLKAAGASKHTCDLAWEKGVKGGWVQVQKQREHVAGIAYAADCQATPDDVPVIVVSVSTQSTSRSR